MKTKTKALIGLGTLLAATLTLAACSFPKAPYKELGGEGFNVRIRYDKNGGAFSNSANTDLVDVYSYESAENGVKLVAPGDSKRGSLSAAASTATRNGYFLAGWYKGRDMRTDEGGAALDEGGVLCSESGKEQGYVYSDKWDFSADYLTLDDLTETKEDGVTYYDLTLYAAWVPNFTYSFYYEGESGWEKYGDYAINPQTTVSIDLPEWNTETGALDYYRVPTREGFTFTEAFADSACTVQYSETVSHPGEIDLEHGIGSGIDLPVYTKWKTGTWFKIETAQQLSDNAMATGCYEILDNLDFANVVPEEDTRKKVIWAFANMTFEGTFEGNGHTITNISTTQSDQFTMGALFGSVGAAAKFENIHFTDIVLELTAATRLQGGQYGLFAGQVDAKATFTGVTLSGTIGVGNLIKLYGAGNANNFSNFTVGLVNGNCAAHKPAIDATVEAVVRRTGLGTYNAQGQEDVGYPVVLEKQEDGTIAITENPDPANDPNSI